MLRTNATSNKCRLSSEIPWSLLQVLAYRKESERHGTPASHSRACTSITQNCHFKITAQRSFSKLFTYHLGERTWESLGKKSQYHQHEKNKATEIHNALSDLPNLKHCPGKNVGRGGTGSSAEGAGASLLHLTWPRTGWKTWFGNTTPWCPRGPESSCWEERFTTPLHPWQFLLWWGHLAHNIFSEVPQQFGR